MPIPKTEPVPSIAKRTGFNPNDGMSEVREDIGYVEQEPDSVIGLRGLERAREALERGNQPPTHPNAA